MSSVVLMTIKTKHQNVCSTFVRHTRPTPQSQPCKRDSNMQILAKPIGSLLILLLIIFFSLNLSAQSISGKITDTTNKALAYSTIALKTKDTTKTVITNSDGTFQFSNIKKGELYNLHISCIGFKFYDTILSTINTNSILLNIALQSEVKNLSTVTVTSTKPLITRKADRYILNVENSFLSSGYNAMDILQRSPGIWIDNSGVIKLRGKTNITVMINGVLQRMNYDELSDYLKTLKSETISKIEVVTNPGAEYDAESSGGFVNIILKKSKKEGLIGTAATTYKQQSKWPYFSPSIGLNFRAAKITSYASYSYMYDKNEHHATTDITYPSQKYYNLETNIDEKKQRQQAIFGLIYDLSKKETFGLQNVYTNTSFLHDFSTGIVSDLNALPFIGNAATNEERNSWRNTTTLNYNRIMDSLGSSLSLIADYTINQNTSSINFNSKYSNASQDSVYRSTAPYSTNISAIQTDYKKVLPKSTELKLGFKASFINRINNLRTENFYPPNWVTDIEATNNHIYDETIYALYASLNKSIKKTDLSVGVRYEHTSAKGLNITNNQKLNSSYYNIFPSFSIQNTFNEKKEHSLYFSFNMPFTRPDFNALNPYRLKIDNYSYQIGNPNLKPQTGYSFDAGVNLSNQYNIGVYFSLTKNVFANILTPLSNNIIEYQLQNFTNSSEFGCYTTLPVKIANYWNLTADAQLYYLKYTLGQYNNSQLAYSLQVVQIINLPKIFDIDIIAKYQSPFVYSNAKAYYQFYTDIGFTRKILKTKGKLRFLITDITNSLRDKNITTYNNSIINFYQKKPTRTFGITFSYNFNTGVKFKAKGVNQLGNEEKSRLDK
jgi:outer membrane receptor protein involved in Fe transport